jgi:predicted metalloprotease with PDZ domain
VAHITKRRGTLSNVSDPQHSLESARDPTLDPSAKKRGPPMTRTSLTPLLRTALVITLLAATPCVAGTAEEITLQVDAGEIGRGLVHAEIHMPVTARPLRLVYPRWGADWTIWEDSIFDVTDLHFRAGDEELVWRRDPLDLFAFDIDVPPEATYIDVSFDVLLEPDSFTPLLARLYWEQVLLLPPEAALDETNVAALLRPPAEWTAATALAMKESTEGEMAFLTVPVKRLIDAPVVMGLHSQQAEVVAPDAPPFRLVVFADDPVMLDVIDHLADQLGPLVTEAGELFGGFQYPAYTMILAISDHMSHYALEHLDSSEHYYPTSAFTDGVLDGFRSSTPAHELVHSWNGEHRKPSGLVPRDLSTPMTTELVWVYEGLTSHLGYVLAARSGFWTPAQARDAFAVNAELMRSESGRCWRSLQDTADAARFVHRPHWSARRRSTRSFYDEGSLLWLEVDVIIRDLTRGQSSLDDFCRLYAGPGSSGDPYDLDEILTTLNRVAAYGWRSFFDERVSRTRPEAPINGLELAGWRLVRSDEPSEMLLEAERLQDMYHFLFRCGLTINDQGEIDDVFAGFPADFADLAPGSRVLAVDRLRFTPLRLRRATGTTELIVEHEELFSIKKLDIPEGGDFPALERIADRPDLLAEIFKPRASSVSTE